MSVAVDKPADPTDLASSIADLAAQLANGEIPDGQRWQRTYELHRLAGQLLRETPDDRPEGQISPPPTRRFGDT